MVRKYRGEIQALRTIAVLAVVVYHINPDWLPGGFIGVDVFFVISGYLITAGLLRRVAEHGRISAADFWANRARRILPAATLTIITVTIASLFILPRSQFATLSLQAVASGFYVQNYALARQSVDYLAADSAPTPFQHFWSLSIEEQFYIFWPMLVVAAWHIAQRIRWASPTDDIRHRRRVRVIATVLFFAVVGGRSPTASTSPRRTPPARTSTRCHACGNWESAASSRSTWATPCAFPTRANGWLWSAP